MCQGRFINCSKCTTLIEDICSMGCCECVGTGVYGKSLYVLLSCAVNKTSVNLFFMN